MNDNEALDHQLDRIQKMNTRELKDLWQELYFKPAPAMHPNLLRMRTGLAGTGDFSWGPEQTGERRVGNTAQADKERQDHPQASGGAAHWYPPDPGLPR